MPGRSLRRADLAEYIAQYMSAHGWDLETATNQMKIPRTTLHAILHRTRVPTLPTLQLLSEAMQVPIERLVGLAGFSSSAKWAGEPAIRSDRVESRPSLRRLVDATQRIANDAEWSLIDRQMDAIVATIDTMRTRIHEEIEKFRTDHPEIAEVKPIWDE